MGRKLKLGFADKFGNYWLARHMDSPAILRMYVRGESEGDPEGGGCARSWMVSDTDGMLFGAGNKIRRFDSPAEALKALNERTPAKGPTS